MTLTLPDTAATARLTAADLKIELACALYGRGRLSAVAAADLAGVDFFTFQEACRERGVAKLYTNEDLDREIVTLNQLFPERPIQRRSDSCAAYELEEKR